MADFGSDVDAMLAAVRGRGSHFADFVATLQRAVASGPSLLTGLSLEEDVDQYDELVRHVERIWDDAVLLYQSGSFPASTYLAICAMEETGKVGVTRFHILIRESQRQAGTPPDNGSGARRRGNPFYSHPDKQLLVAGAGAIVNNRLARIVGTTAVDTFLAAVQDGSLERLRQAALYAEMGDEGPVLPASRIGEDDARLYVVIAGELLAEVLGVEPGEWMRTLDKVKAFEESVGMPFE